MNRLSIIIVNWNTRQLLLDCLSSIACSGPPDGIEIWVVDNASTDGSAEAVRAAFPDVRLIVNRGNVGFAAANNQAIAASRGELVLLLNSDTLVLPGALAQLARFMEHHPSVGIAGARLLNRDRTLQPSWAKFPSLWSELAGRNQRSRRPFATGDGSTAFAVDWVGGACLMIRRPAIEQIGMLDDNFFMYAEEMDWCYRARQAGWEVCYCPAPEVIHLGGQSSRSAPARMKAALYSSKLRFFRKHYGASRALALRAGLQALLLGKAGAQLALALATGRRSAAAAPYRDSLAVARAIAGQ